MRGSGSGSRGGAGAAYDAEAARRAQQELMLCQAASALSVAIGGPQRICQIDIPAAPAAGGDAAGPAAPAIDPAVVAQSATMRLPIPMPVAKIGPDPNLNEWKMAAVGYPLWLWVEGPDPYEHRMTVTEQGITLNLVAKRQTTQFDLGDGEVKYCGATPAWTRSVTPGEPSKRCGYVYEQPSLPKGTYAVTATTIWVVEWSALGQSGTLPFERTGPATQLPVGELHAVRVR